MPAKQFFKCEVCGYVHTGDAPPDTCPVCGVGPDQFVPLEVEAESAPAPAARAWRCTVCNYVHLGDEPLDQCPVCGVGAELFEPEELDEQDASADGRRVVILGGGWRGSPRRSTPGRPLRRPGSSWSVTSRACPTTAST